MFIPYSFCENGKTQWYYSTPFSDKVGPFHSYAIAKIAAEAEELSWIKACLGE